MKTCKKCSKEFKTWINIDGKPRNLSNRKFCFDCSPWGEHNTVDITKQPKVQTDEKYCPKCETIYKLSEFYIKRKTEPSTYCKKCAGKYSMDRWKSKKRMAVELMGGKCQECGYDKCISAMEFHHLDPSKKDFDFGKGRTYSWERYLEELKKCVMLCCRCHREKHATEDMFIKGVNPKDANSRLVSQGLVSTGECQVCQAPVYGTKYCSQACSHYSKRKVLRPSKEQLKLDIKELSYLAIGRKYNVSDASIRKWEKQYEI